jgi:hypothetical protein
MKLRYLIVDGRGQLRKASQAAVEALWHGRCRADALGGADATELRLVSAVCDDRLLPAKIFLLRVPLTDGAFTAEDQLTLHIFTRSELVTAREVVAHHGEGWPDDLLRQLAVALDVPAAGLGKRLRVGGPLFLAAAMRVTPHQALRYLR